MGDRKNIEIGISVHMCSKCPWSKYQDGWEELRTIYKNSDDMWSKTLLDRMDGIEEDHGIG